MNLPTGIALDIFSNIYVADAGDDSIRVYRAGSSGDVAPIATIMGNLTQLTDPEGVAISPNGNINVANHGSNTITVYRAGADGDIAPLAKIAGSKLKLKRPSGHRG